MARHRYHIHRIHCSVKCGNLCKRKARLLASQFVLAKTSDVRAVDGNRRNFCVQTFTSRQRFLQLLALVNKAIVDIRLRDQFGAALWWVTFSMRRYVKSTLPPVESL